MWILITVVVFATIAVVVVVANIVNSERQVKFAIEHEHGLDEAQIRRELNVIVGRQFVDGNAIEHLCNGDEIFPAMLDGINQAQRTINFETYIYWAGITAQKFTDALGARARDGVKVNVLLDWAGCVGMDDELVKSMVDAGVEVQYYHPLRWYQAWRMNNRTHRKLLVIDGSFGFIGGVGIADEWLGNAQDSEHWRDSHFRVTGPVVAQLQAAFLDNWLKTAGRILRGPDYFPALNACGDASAQVLASSPSGGSESMHLLYMLNLSAARETIDLSAAYFVPDSVAMNTLLNALERGVRLRIIMPGEHNDSNMVYYASRANWARLLEAGAELYEFEPTMHHVKMLIVDTLTTSVGSTNFDIRSFRLNNEASMTVYDGKFATEMSAVFAHDLTRCRRITPEAWARRPRNQRLIEYFFHQFSSQL